MSFDSNQSSSSFAIEESPYRDSSSVEYKLSLLLLVKTSGGLGSACWQNTCQQFQRLLARIFSCPTSGLLQSLRLLAAFEPASVWRRSCDGRLEFRTRVLTTIFLNTFLSETSTLVGGSLMTTLKGHSFHIFPSSMFSSFTEQSLSPWTSHISPLGV